MDQISTQLTDQVSSQINQYLQQTTGNITTDVTNFVFQWFVLPSIIFMVVFMAIYIFRTVRRYRVEKAVFEIRDLLTEMNHSKPLPESYRQALHGNDTHESKPTDS